MRGRLVDAAKGSRLQTNVSLSAEKGARCDDNGLARDDFSLVYEDQDLSVPRRAAKAGLRTDTKADHSARFTFDRFREHYILDAGASDLQVRVVLENLLHVAFVDLTIDLSARTLARRSRAMS